MLIGEPCLVWEGVDDVNPHLASSTVGPGGCDRVPDTAVHQPAWAALVKSLFPGGEQLPGGGQGGVQFLTVLHGLIIGETVIVTGEEDLTCKNERAATSRTGQIQVDSAYIYSSNLFALGYEKVHAAHLANVPRNKIHHKARWLVSGHRT